MGGMHGQGSEGEFFQRLSFEGSLEQGCREVEADTGAPIGRNYPRFPKRFAEVTKKLANKLPKKFPEAFGFAKSISEEVKDKPGALKWGSAMALFLQKVEAEVEVAWLAITMLHERGIEVSAFIHDGLLVHCEDADAISIEGFAADLWERLGFRWLTLEWKPLEVTRGCAGVAG